MMPKLLQINVDSALYSCGKICEGISIVAQAHGWDTYIAYGREHREGVNKEIKVGGRWNVYEHFIEHRFFDNEGLASRLPTKRLIKTIEKIDPDIIQIHIIHDHWINFPLLFDYLNKKDIPIVWTFHDCWALTGHCFHFLTKKCYKWQTHCRECPLSRTYPKSYIDHSVRNFDLKKRFFLGNNNLTIVPCSNWMDKVVKESFLKKKKTHVINNGIDLDVFKPINVDRGDLFTILAVSSVWNKEKGLYDVFELRKLLSSDYKIIIVGLSKRQLSHIPNGIIGIQRTNSVEEMVRLYASSNVLINLTYADTFPTVNIEALACGTPVITYDSGGSSEIVDDKTGVVVPTGDISSVVREIEKMKTRPLSSSECRKRVELLYDKRNNFEKYISLYDDLLKR